jgi:hypothetical protein
MNNNIKNNKIKLTVEEKKAKLAAYKKNWATKNKERLKAHYSEYRKNNKEKIKISKTKYYKNNKQKISNNNKKYFNLNKKKISIKQKEYYKNNLKKIKKRANVYYKNNKEKCIKRSVAYKNKRRKTDLNFKLQCILRSRLKNILIRKKINKIYSYVELVGCTIQELKLHIESQFKEDMTWDNHNAKGWHIDHIKPCVSFDLSDPEQQRECFHFTNLQPLWWYENLSKGCKL